MSKNTGSGDAFRRIEWLTVGLIFACYTIWLAAGLLLWPIAPLLALAVLSITVALQSSLVHEVLHGHPTRSGLINEAFVSVPIGLAWPYRRYKALHLRHHRDERLTDPFDDPESFYKARWKYDQMPRIFQYILHLNNVLLVRVFLGPILGIFGLVWTDCKSILTGNREVLLAWLRHILLSIPVVLVVILVFKIPLWIYIVGPVWIGHGIISIRTYAEHQWSESADGRTLIVERSILGLLFLNNNLHIVHHTLPAAPWYKLPSIYWANREEWQRRNGGYVYPNYLSLLMRYAFRAKEPVTHPAWRRDIEQRFIFLPKGNGQQGDEGANIPAVAKPQKD